MNRSAVKMVYESYESLRDYILSQVGSRLGLVSIDGESGSGKTALAMNLARDVGGVRVSTDSYLIAGSSGPYQDRLAIDFLADDLTRFKEQFPVIFFEGICVRDILGKLRTEAALSMYVKKIASNGLWHFEFHLETFASGNDPQLYADEPFHSDYEYHNGLRPHESSDVTYVRVAD